MSASNRFKFASRVVDATTGEFSGYGAVFGNVDSHRDLIKYGAFRTSLAGWKARGRLPTMKLQHGSSGNPFTGDDLPIGVWTEMREDSHGLFVRGRLLALDTDLGRRLLSLMSASAMDGLSIGFRVKKSERGVGNVQRVLTEIDLREVSLVDEPSNDLARVSSGMPAQAAASDAFDNLRAAVRALAESVPTKAIVTEVEPDGDAARLAAALTRLARAA